MLISYINPFSSSYYCYYCADKNKLNSLNSNSDVTTGSSGSSSSSKENILDLTGEDVSTPGAGFGVGGVGTLGVSLIEGSEMSESFKQVILYFLLCYMYFLFVFVYKYRHVLSFWIFLFSCFTHTTCRI